jgi:hypothetical protein
MTVFSKYRRQEAAGGRLTGFNYVLLFWLRKRFTLEASGDDKGVWISAIFRLLYSIN